MSKAQVAWKKTLTVWGGSEGYVLIMGLLFDNWLVWSSDRDEAGEVDLA